MHKLLFVPGSLRSASASRATVRALVHRLDGAAGMSVADVGLLPHYNADIEHDAAVETFKGQVDAAAGVVFVTPEYNYSIPGVLKNAIDWASRPAYQSVFLGKPCVVITLSGGALGGVRAQSHLKYVLNGMLANVYPCKEMLVGQANAKVTDGRLIDEAVLDFAEENLRGFLATLDRG